ncbi:MAG: type II toxin-antitoxin system RelE/ParE family toxin [Ginsengibacter sp.]
MPRFTVKYAPEALEEIRQIVDYYNELSGGLGNRFKQNLLEAIKAAKLNPSYNSFRYNDVRFAVVKKFPYAAHYTIDMDKHIVKIQAVLGFSQNPDTTWRIRF